jgi:hypothetical protein
MTITDEEILDMFHRLTDEEKVSIFSQMILMEKWRESFQRGTESSPVSDMLHLYTLRHRHTLDVNKRS